MIYHQAGDSHMVEVTNSYFQIVLGLRLKERESTLHVHPTD